MDRPLSTVSLRVLMLVLVGLLGAVALLFAARDLVQSRETVLAVESLARENAIADHGLQAIKAFAMERGRSNVVMRGEGLIGVDDRQLIHQRRAAADEHIAAIIAGQAEGMNSSIEELKRAWARVKWLRPELDKDFERLRDARAPTLAAAWLEAANSLMTAIESAMIDLGQRAGRTDAGFDRINTLRIQAMQLRDLLGGESTVFGSELSANREASPEVIRTLVGTVNYLRGRSSQLWTQFEPGVKQVCGDEGRAALDTLRDLLFNRLRPQQNEILRAIEGGKRSQIRLRDYLEASTATLNASVDVGNAINRTAELYTKARLAEAQRQTLSSIVRIVAILMLASLVAVVLFIRLTKPLRGILGHINALLGSQSASATLPIQAVRGDEFGRIRQALDVLEKVMADRLRQKAALDDSERINASILARTPQAIIVSGNDGLIRVFSPGAEEMLGYAAAEVVGKLTLMTFLDPEQLKRRAARLAEELGRPVEADWNVLVAMKTVSAAKASTARLRRRDVLAADQREWTFVRKDRKTITVLCEATQMTRESGEFEGCLFVASDITARAMATVEMERLAHYDTLTGLPNRRLLHDRVQMAITQARREKSRLGLMLVDLDRFKPVNDELGHAAGDALLKEVANRMQRCLRESDTLARLGGDEFVVLLPGVAHDRDALLVADKIRAALCEPFDLPGGHTVFIGCSIGLVVFPEHGRDEKRLLSNADEAMYLAKERGRNRVQLFNGSMVESAPVAADESRKARFPVMRLVWHDAYLCGEPSLDQEHREIFDRANELIHAVVSGDDQVVDLYDALDELVASSEAHFANEERILARCRYPDLEEHVLEHQNLMARAQVLRRKAIAGELTLGALVTFIVQDVVVKHMLTEDRRYYPYLKAMLADGGRESSGMPDVA